jgi:hypothetical protein
MIYKHTYSNSTISVTPISSPKQQSGPLSLRQTCRQLRFEACAPFFAHTTFKFSAYGLQAGTASRLGEATYSAIQAIHLSEGLCEEIVEVSLLCASSRDLWLKSMSRPKLASLMVVSVDRDSKVAGSYARDALVELTRRLFGKEELQVRFEQRLVDDGLSRVRARRERWLVDRSGKIVRPSREGRRRRSRVMGRQMCVD